MDRFQIVEVTEEFNHAGSKATADVATIADRLDFIRMNLKMDTTVESSVGKVRRQIGYFRDWKKVDREITQSAVLLLQHPFHYKQVTRERTLRSLKEKKGIKIISVVHDVEELRAFRFNNYYKHEFRTMIELADVIIVHNSVMKKWFIERGVNVNKLFTLDIFDYLQESNTGKQIVYEKSITIAGNLDTVKCGYIGKLGELDNVQVHLYGPNYDERLKNAKNVEYHGSYPVNEIPGKLNRGFGLVWDGESIDGCKGLSGQYLRYNNPHKLSLYLSSGMPVVIWKKAAEAEFVQSNNVGILVNNLKELKSVLDGVNEEHFKQLINNVSKVSDKLCKGYYAEKAIKDALNKVEV